MISLEATTNQQLRLLVLANQNHAKNLDDIATALVEALLPLSVDMQAAEPRLEPIAAGERLKTSLYNFSRDVLTLRKAITANANAIAAGVTENLPVRDPGASVN